MNNNNESNEIVRPSLNFLEQIIENDIKNGKNDSRVHTRFPPEPNGYLHIGHAKSICLNFGLAKKYNGKCNLRFDDTNPVKEDTEYVDSIMEDVHWLGFDWEGRLFYASDYFETLYQFAIELIKKGKAYVCDMTPEEISAGRGTPSQPGKHSPWRDRSVEENLELFERMRNGEFADGTKVLRAKIDMASPNMHMRDPIMYRILHAHHHRTGDKWCIYPMYDWAHGQSDYLEGITHSICTLEFEVHRPLYDWFLDNLGFTGNRPQQSEFARLNITYTVMSKRKLLELVKNNYVNGWDDPRMPTICGLRRRGYTPESIRNFAEKVGVAKRENVIDVALLEHCIREDLNKKAPRIMSVLNPLKLVIDNYPDGQIEDMDGLINPEQPELGNRKIPFSKHLFIEKDDFMEEPPKKYHRLYVGNEVRLKYGYIVKCESFEKDPITGEITLIHCSYDPTSRSGNDQTGKKVKGTIHWVSQDKNVEIETRLYDRLFMTESPEYVEEGLDYKTNLNPESLKVVIGYAEPSLMNYNAGDSVQFERLGYFCMDKDSTTEKLVLNRTVTLKDSWSKMDKKD